ncbi:IS66 family transposase [Leptolyngbya sp. BC1307]|uniref:IS66 family transposase n=1 Tax=Leptolyngbya sp. BC1307 TaxID=2029589 RepID=UPI000EFC7AEE|nr:IS66 family transposase [Leptolyngbya sp. BC1307]
MEKLPDLSSLSGEAKDALIVLLWEEVQHLRQRLEELERPKKTSENSSVPPSKGFKANKQPPKGKKGGERRAASVGRTGGGRKLHLHPDETVIAQLSCCPACAAAMPLSNQRLQSRYERIELPEIKPIVTRVERYQGRCDACGTDSIAPVPGPLAPGSPFGQSIESLATYLRYGHAISYERMHQLLAEVFNLSISEGGLANLLTRVKDRLDDPLSEILSHLRQADLICSDETSARVHGKNEWEWVFQNPEVCFHTICATRGGSVIYAVLEDHEPEVWVSDLFSAQASHPAKQWQVCLAHQLRDCQYAMDAGDSVFAPEMKALFKRALAIHRRRAQLADSTRYQYRLDIKRQLRRILDLAPDQADGIRLKTRYEGIHDNLFLFLEDAAIPPTNNSSEQAIRMSTLFRKVTNGFRSDWGKDLFAAVRSIVNTGKRQGFSALQAIQIALSGRSLFQTG